jgi:multisubunit Na+/H+ antiporter MnhG subunit
MIAMIIGVLISLLGLIGLFLARDAYDIGMTTFGFGLFVFAVWLDFWLIRLHFKVQAIAVRETD